MSSAACLKRSYSCRRRTSSARGSSSIAFLARRARQQHARLDLGQDRGHHQVFGGQLEAQLLHRLDVVDVLAGDLGDRDVEDVQVLPADQVQQQVERAFEGLEDDFQRIRRDVQVLRDLQHRLAVHHRQRHFLLLGAVGLRGVSGTGGRRVPGPGRDRRGRVASVDHASRSCVAGPLRAKVTAKADTCAPTGRSGPRMPATAVGRLGATDSKGRCVTPGTVQPCTTRRARRRGAGRVAGADRWICGVVHPVSGSGGSWRRCGDLPATGRCIRHRAIAG